MTNESLERGKEIRYAIDMLKRALSEVSRNKFFSVDDGHGFVRSADTSLAQIENDLKHEAQTRILFRIDQLESEFSSL